MEFVLNTKKRKMSALTSSVCLLACFLTCSVSTEIKVKSGDDVTLQCQSTRGEDITLLTWRRADLKTVDHVFFFRENRSYEIYQHPSFRGRVHLRDPEMKDGNVSVILKNVNINDAGTYKCLVSVNNKGRELMNIIYLKVEDSGHTAGNTLTEGHKDEGHKAEGHKDGRKKDEGNLGLIVGLPVALVLVLVAVVGFVIYRQRRQRPDQPVHYTAAATQQV